MHSKHIHIGCTQREHGRRKITCTRYRDRRRSLRAWEKAKGRALCVSLEAIDPTPGRLGSSDPCVCTIRSIAPVHRHANSTRPHRGIVHSTSTHSTSTQHTSALRKCHTGHAHTRADRASCPPQQSAHTHTGTPNTQHGARRRALRMYRHGTPLFPLIGLVHRWEALPSLWARASARDPIRISYVSVPGQEGDVREEHRHV